MTAQMNYLQMGTKGQNALAPAGVYLKLLWPCCLGEVVPPSDWAEGGQAIPGSASKGRCNAEHKRRAGHACTCPQQDLLLMLWQG